MNVSFAQFTCIEMDMPPNRDELFDIPEVVVFVERGETGSLGRVDRGWREEGVASQEA